MRLIHIYKTYHNKNNDVLALKDINLSLDNHGMTFIVGSSGCGKTTLLNIISGHDLQFYGTIEKDGIVECIEQDIMLLENMSILDNLNLVSNDKELIQRYLKQFQLPDQHRKVKKLSVGEKKRVQIIRSLLTKADYLICDEPTASLDYENSQMIMELLKEVSKNIGVIIVTHDIALVERYQDRVIQMGKGCILEDEPFKETINHINEVIMKKQHITKQFNYLIKMFRSRLAENIFKYILLFLGVITVYVLICLYPSLNASMSGRTNWLNGNNVIITEPIDTTTICYYRDYSPYYHYDFYKKEDVYLAHDNIDGIIGYSIGWNPDKFVFALVEQRPLLNIDELREVVDEYKDNYFQTGMLPFFGYDFMVAELANYDEKYPNNSFPKDQYIFADYRIYLGFELYKPNNNNEINTNSSIYPSLSNFPKIPNTETSANFDNHGIVRYTLFPKVKLDLIVGHMPSSNDEIIVSKSLGEALMKRYQLSSLEELVGHPVQFTFIGDYEHEASKKTYVSYPLTISGVTYMESQIEDQAFAYEGTFENPFIEEFGYNPEVVSYSFANFLTDPKKDSKVIAEQLNCLLESKDSRFEILGMSNDVKEEYQDPLQIVVFTSFTLFALLVLYLMMQILFNRRIVKEHNILHRYHYQPLFIQLMLLGLLMILVALPQLGLFTYICDFLNHLANHLGMADIVTYDTLQYLKTWIIILVVMMLIEVVMDKIRVKLTSR